MSAVRVCSAADVPEAGALRVEAPGPRGELVPVAVVRDEDGELHAISDTCSHQAVSLSEGDVEGCMIECWLHGSMFDLRTGKPTNLPATEPVATFPVDVRDGVVYVDTETTLNGVTPA